MKHRFWWRAGAVLATVAVLGVLAFQVTVRRLHGNIERALGPGASVGSLKVGWASVELRDLQVRASRVGWPAQDELRAARVIVVPEMASLFGNAWRVRSVDVEGAYMSVLRSSDGKLQVLPALFDHTAKPGSAASKESPSSDKAAPNIQIGHVSMTKSQLDFYDASVRKPAHAIRINELAIELDHIAIPALDQAMHIDLQGMVKGPHRDGRIKVAGEFTPATHDAQLKGQLAGVDLIALQPYLVKLNEGGVRAGTLDLVFDASVVKNHLRAPGVITLTGLELNDGGGLLGTFAGVPRRAVIASMSEKGRIELKFSLDGRLDDPKFSLNEQLAVRAAAGLAESLGVTLGGMVEGVGSVIKGLFGH
ncbi:DUF748 domain-containing protein [Aquabacterium sp. CECT 9606]|uniref:DUF748 domain-containing protein n=1 Tax=Aquabacterium sp. CECT 9606 TaxID=2845822 RepID=UPI001E414A06|nr:DUF748 domain-containing protein [Aquabacterium sp. CECT 9606]CAH0355059.1 hypothetical protein AQB9606_04151 [Aquabacterium sp. CECT 9606]